jgi:two-component system phosphate regulon response regulator PhoB
MNTGLQSEIFRNWTHQRIVFAESLVLHYGDICVDLDAYRVTRAGVLVHLGPTEYRLLCFLLEHPCCVHSREDLIAAAWPEGTHIRSCTVDMHILRLRRALMAHGGYDRISTIKSAGYMLE